MFKSTALAVSFALNAAVAVVAAFGVGYILGNIEQQDIAMKAAKKVTNIRPK